MIIIIIVTNNHNKNHIIAIITIFIIIIPFSCSKFPESNPFFNDCKDVAGLLSNISIGNDAVISGFSVA